MSETSRNLIQGGTEVIPVPVCISYEKMFRIKSLLYYFCNYQIIREREIWFDSLNHKPQFLESIKLVNEKDFKARVDQILYFQARQLYLHGLK